MKKSTVLLWTIILIETLGGVEVDLFVPAFPELRRVFQLSPFMVQLTLSINFIAYCVCCIFAGTLGDRFNRRHIILGGLLIFTLGSALCVFAQSFPMLLGGRFLQGIGIASPAVLAFAIIADEYPVEQQITLLGIMNGVATISMAFAPTIGSYINLYFDWRGNFVLLLILGILCSIVAYYALPNRREDASVSLSLKAYLPLVQSKRFLTFTGAIAFFVVPYWLFTAFAPILYMENLGVSLKDFGYYQGVMAVVFAVISLLNGKMLKWFGQKRCLVASAGICLLAIIFLLVTVFLKIQDPIWITAVMGLLVAGMVFPVNILFPLALNIVENTKGRATAVITAARLMLTGLALQSVGFFYDGTFFLTGIVIVFCTLLGLYFTRIIFINKWGSWL